MITKTMLPILLLASFFSLSAQNTDANAPAQRPLTFESVSFSMECGSITILCDAADQLTDFEINGQDAHSFFDWDGKQATDRFSMKLSFQPGVVTIKYKMRDMKSKTVQLKIVPRDEVKLTL